MEEDCWSVQERWEENRRVIDSKARGVWQISINEITRDKETSWGNDELKDAIRAKKGAKKKWETT